MKGERRLVSEMTKYAFLGVMTDDGWSKESEDLANPDRMPRVITSISKVIFFRHVGEEEIDYMKGYETLWISAMSKWVVNELYLTIEDDDDHIYVLYDVLNDQTHPEMLGRLSGDHEFSKLVRRALKKFMEKAI
jgi:hypothetical protein